MKLYYALQTDAQAKADSIHAQLIATNPAYAKSVSDGQTKRWDFPAQDTDSKGSPIITSQWGVNVDDRVTPVLSSAEKTLLGIASIGLGSQTQP